jgi:hypothetical protein
MVLAGSVAGRAQSSATSPAVPVATPAKAVPPSQAAQPAAPSERRPGGTHEGIKVHGHWTIEIRNPDGKVVSHTEFENSLISGEGDALLAQLLTGGQSVGDWMVILNTSALPSNSYAYSQPGPCGTSGASACILGQSGSSAFTTTVGGITATTCANKGNCFSTLAVSLGGANNAQVQLAGTTTANTSGSIGSVTTQANTCYGSGGTSGINAISPSSCFSNPGTTPGVSGYDPQFTNANLVTPVPVSPGQTIAVTVVISFQ